MKFIKKLLCDFYKIFILKDDRYIGYTPGNFLCDRFIHSFMLRYPRKHLSEETIQRVDDVGTVMGFNDDHLVKYLCLNIIDRGAYSFLIEDVYEKVHNAFGHECSWFTLYLKSISYIKWAIRKKSTDKCWMSKYVDTLSPMGTLDTHSYNIPKEFRWYTVNVGLLNSLYADTNVTFDEFIKTLIINKGGLLATEPEKYNNFVAPFDTIIDVNKLYNEFMN